MSDSGDWVGRARSGEDLLSPFPARAMRALLDRPATDLLPGAPLPCGWHWLYFHRAARASELGADGHERRGSFLPPVPLPRRMWAGGRVRFPGTLRLGEEGTRRSTIQSVKEKLGRTGPLVFVTVQHEVTGADGVAVIEEQDLVYGVARIPGAPLPVGSPVPEEARPLGTFTADEVALFRFSALTFNGHRIHYDHPYATETEGYPGLVVHGPLLALLLLDAADGERARADEGARLTGFTYRAVSPAFCGEEITLSGRHVDGGIEVFAGTTNRGTCMTAMAEWTR